MGRLIDEVDNLSGARLAIVGTDPFALHANARYLVASIGGAMVSE